MQKISCKAGVTQIVEGIDLALAPSASPSLIVVVGDSFEEQTAALQRVARKLCKQSIPVFAFLDGKNETAEEAFRMLASETRGVFARLGEKLDLSSLMRATGAYATGGTSALLKIADRSGKEGKAAVQMLEQLLLPAPGKK